MQSRFGLRDVFNYIIHRREEMIPSKDNLNIVIGTHDDTEQGVVTIEPLVIPLKSDDAHI